MNVNMHDYEYAWMTRILQLSYCIITHVGNVDKLRKENFRSIKFIDFIVAYVPALYDPHYWWGKSW